MPNQLDPLFNMQSWGMPAPVQSAPDFLASLRSYGGSPSLSPAMPYAGATQIPPLTAQLKPALDLGGGSSWWDNFAGKRNADGSQTMGWGGPALGGAQALSSLWMGMKNYNLAKDQLAFQKEAFGKNFGAQVATTNSQLQDRQAARVAADPTNYESVASYMAKHGIRG